MTPFKVEDGFTPQFDATSSYSVWPQNQQPAYVHEYSLTTEYALSNTLSLSVGYLGETGQHLADYRNANQLTLAQATIIANLPDGRADSCFCSRALHESRRPKWRPAGH